MFTVERHELLEDFVFFCALCEVQPSPLAFAPNRPIIYLGPPTVVDNGRDSVLEVYVFLSWVLNLDNQTLVHRV